MGKERRRPVAPNSGLTDDRFNTNASDAERRETERLAALDYLDAVRPEVDRVLQQLVDDVREAFDTDLCMVNLVLSDVQYFRAWSGELPSGLAKARQDPLEHSMCQYVVEMEKPLVVEDLLATEKFKDQHFLLNYGIRFYAGTPLITSEGHVIGTLCLLGTQPKEISQEQMTLLGAFAQAVVGRLELLGALRREQTAREDEARRSRELHQRTLDSSQDVIATVGADGTFKTINRAVERVLGYEAEELVGRNYLGLVHPDDRDLSIRLTGVIEDGTKEARFENRCLRKDGGVVYIEWNVTARPEEGLVHCVAHDVTKRKRAEEEVRKSEARHRAVVETADDAILTMTSDGLIRSFNPGAERTFGYKAEEAVGQPLRMLMPERFRGPHEEGFRRYLKTGEAHVVGKGPVELTGLRKSGEEFPLELSLGEMRSGDNLMFTGVIRDITDRKRAEEAVRENEKRFRQLFEQSLDTLLVHDSRGCIVDCNEEACRSLGYTREELLSLRIKDLATNLVSDEGKRPRTEPTLWQRAMAGEPGRIAGAHRGEHRRKDDTTFPVEVHVGSVDYGGERMIFASARDITERKQAEEQLRQAETRYRMLIERMPAVTYIQEIGSPDSALYMSPQIETLTGYSPEDCKDPDLRWSMVHAEDREWMQSQDEQTGEPGEVFTTEYRVLHRDGRTVWVRNEAVMIKEEASESRYWQGFIIDITERKRAEEEIRQLNEELEGRVEERTAQLQGTLAELENTLTKHERAVARERTLRSVSAALVAAPDRERIYAAALEGILPFIDEAPGTRVSIWSGSSEKDVCMGAAGDHAAEIEGRETYIHQFPDWVRLPLLEGRPVELRPLDAAEFQSAFAFQTKLGALFMIPLIIQGELRGRIVVASDSALLSEIKYALETLGSQVALALERSDLIEDLHRRQSEERFGSLIQNSSDIIMITEADRTVSYISPAVEQVLGYKPEDIIGKISFTHVHPEDSAGVQNLIADAISKPGVTLLMELRLQHADGSWRHIETHCTNLLDDPAVGGVVLNARDITERKQVEEDIRRLNETLERRVEERTKELEAAVTELKESEERYVLVAEGSNDGIFDWDLRTSELFWNERLYEIVGLSRSTFTPTLDDFFELLHPEDRERVSENLTAHLERGSGYNVEFRLRHSDGGYRTCITRGKAQYDEERTPFRMAGTVTDITERKRAEEAQRFLVEASAELASSLDYRATLASVARLAVPGLADWCAVDVLEADGSINRLVVTHEDPEKVRWARELQERFPPDPNAPYGAARVLRTGESEFMPEIPESVLDEAVRNPEHREILRKMGLKSYMVVPLIARGRTLGAITFVAAESKRRYGPEDLGLAEELARRTGLAVDNARLYDSARKELTERERAEEEIRKLNENLERRVEERTEQLEEAMKAAEAASRAKSDFLANMSHEIRTPMNGVVGMTDLLLDTPLSDEQREYAETVRLSADNLLVIINDILDFSKIEAGKIRIETIDFDLRAAVEDTVTLLAERAHEKGLELASLLGHDMPTALRGDPGRIRQVLTNILGNAIKFTQQGEVVLKADLVEETDGAATIRFEVVDTGIGMTEEQRSRLFQSFMQADTSTTRRFGGTGLGLAISKQLVELMDGEIGVTSEPGVGSTFWFTLPLEKQAEGAQTKPAAPANLRNLRVLIVDDNATNRTILQEQLTAWRMRSGLAENGPRSLEEMRSAAEGGEPYDLAVLDMQMPEMNGIELAQRIKSDPAISPTRLVLLSSSGQRSHDGEEARRAGIEAYLTKPVRQAELYETLATVTGALTGVALEKDHLVTRHSSREKRSSMCAHLLVVEDNPVNQRVAVKMLENLGYRADVANNGLEALEAYSQTSYTAVLMDVQMPEMDGYEATAEIRRRESEDGGDSRRTPIIAMTANAIQGDREKAIETGMDDYVSKPVKSEDLDEVLKRWVFRSDAPDAPLLALDAETSIDYAVLEGLRELQQDGEPDFLVELIELFLNGIPPQLTALREAIEGDDAGTIERISHALKGSCGNMGARQMVTLCAKLQDAGSSGNFAGAPELLGSLEAEFGRVRLALEAEAKRHRS